MSRPFTPLAERFWSKVVKGDGCWLWTGARLKNRGYGMIGAGGDKGKTLLAHRASWELHSGPIPNGAEVLHRCDVPACVRPDHLFLGTQADNIRDMRDKGRRGRCNRKLTADQVCAIRREASRGADRNSLASQYGVTVRNIRWIVGGLTWRNI